MFLGISVDAWSSIFIGVLILAGTITQGTIGFGLGTIATPIIALIRPDLVPTLILLLALCISSYTLARTFRETSWRVVGISSLARIPGSLVGAWAIASLSPDGLSIFIGCAVLEPLAAGGSAVIVAGMCPAERLEEIAANEKATARL